VQGRKIPPGFPTLQKFLIESALFEHVGLNFDDLKNRPVQEAIDYVTIIDAISQEQARQRAKQEAESNKGARRF